MKTIYPEGEGKKVPLQAQVEPTWRQHEAKSERRQSEDGPKIGVEPKVQTSRSAKTYSKTYIFAIRRGCELRRNWSQDGDTLGHMWAQMGASMRLV